MRRIALTGGIATGKSHVRAQLEALGVPTIDSDVLAREAVAPGTPGLAAIVIRFGSDVLDSSAALDRRKLGAIVFADASARRDLEAIVHPVVRAETDAWFARLEAHGQPLAVADVPLLYEVGRDRDFDAVIVVACDPATQRARLMSRDGIGESEASRRIAAQWPIEDKVRRADYVIRTDGTFEETRRQVDDLFRSLSCVGAT
jgi:dephospho-CoA kinase